MVIRTQQPSLPIVPSPIFTKVSTMTSASSSLLLSVIIPTRDERFFIDGCLQSIFSADFPSNRMEVLVVDGMSTDGTRESLEGWRARQSNLRILDNPYHVVPAAMNIGIRAARGKWIIRLDAHSEYPANYLRLCLETAERTGADNVGGIVTTLSRQENGQEALVQALTTHRFGVGNAGFRTGGREGWTDTVPYGCFRRELFEQIGLYDERLVRNQDYELNRRLLKNGGRIWLNPAIQITYYNQNSLSGLLKQAFVTGQWNVWMWFVAPHAFAYRHAVPLAFVAALLGVIFCFLFSSGFARYVLASMLIPYGLMALAASLQQALRHGIWTLPLLPFLFLAYHATYGLGGLCGIWKLATKQSPVQHTSSIRLARDPILRVSE